MKKLTPQQLRVNEEKALAKKSTIEKLLVTEEKWKRHITKVRTEWDNADQVYRAQLEILRKNATKANRLVRYKRAQIIGKEK